jgi:hypothetical protein
VEDSMIHHRDIRLAGKIKNCYQRPDNLVEQ